MADNKRPTVLIFTQENGKNGGPYVNHKRIMKSALAQKYEFVEFSFPRTRKCFLSLFRQIRRVRRISPDIAHIEGLQLTGMLELIVCRMAGVKNNIVAVYGSLFERNITSKIKRAAINFLERYTLTGCTAFYCVSKYVDNWERLARYSHKNMGVIYNLPPESNIMAHQTDIRSEIGISNEDIVITCAARVVADKGFASLCDAIDHFSVWSNIRFIIAGDGDYLDEVKRRTDAARNGMSDRVHCLGYRTDIQQILAGSDIFILLSQHETLSIALIEAAYAGLPCVATNVGGIPEVVEHGKSGILVAFDDSAGVISALDELIGNSDIRRQMGGYAKIMAKEKFSEEVIVKQIDEMYTRILGSNITRVRCKRNYLWK